jgi:hypothetical protein
MPFTGAATITKLPATGINYFKVTDTSDYTDEPKDTFSTRLVYLIDANGDYVENDGLDYFEFGFADYPDDEITIEALTDDIALSVYIVWESLAPEANSTYTLNIIEGFIDNAQWFKLTKVMQMAGNRLLIDNKNFMESMNILQCTIDNVTLLATDTYLDQYEAQKNIDVAAFLMDNPNLFY